MITGTAAASVIGLLEYRRRPYPACRMIELLLVTLASALAGFVDAIVGGGGLVLGPPLLSADPAAGPATLFGKNKGAAVWGTGWATLQYARRVTMNWGTL